jgi:hemoglobin
MELKISSYKIGERPSVSIPDPRFFELLKEEGMRNLVSDHYDLLVKSKIKDLFPKNPEALELAKQHSADFLIQICGGPRYYNENRGKPMLVSRHAPFSITLSARLVWLECYSTVLSGLDLPEDIIMSYWNYINVFSSWMVNSIEYSSFQPVVNIKSS